MLVRKISGEVKPIKASIELRILRCCTTSMILKSRIVCGSSRVHLSCNIPCAKYNLLQSVVASSSKFKESRSVCSCASKKIKYLHFKPAVLKPGCLLLAQRGLFMLCVVKA